MKPFKQQQLFPDDHEDLFFEDGKICIKCEHKLPLTSFSPASGGNFLRPECKKCNNKLSKARIELKQKFGMPTEDNYTCPAGQTLVTNGNWYNKRVYRVKQYKTKNCKSCPVKQQCTKAKYQKIIERHEFAEALEINKENIAKTPEIYAQRQAIVEHPFGTMKRGWGLDHIMTKKFKKRASSDVGFIFTAYNLRRLINIIGVIQLMNQLTTNPLITFLKTHLNRYIRVFKASLITFTV